MALMAQHEGRCPRCDQPIRAGHRIVKARNGWRHYDCSLVHIAPAKQLPPPAEPIWSMQDHTPRRQPVLHGI